MTLVNVDTGEVVTSCSPDEARVLTDQIKVTVEGAWLLITQAYQSRAWSALGYSSWDDYCTREFGTSRLRLPREERSEVVASLRDAGLSIRAIAAAVGVAKQTVSDDVSQSRTPAIEVDSPPPRKVTGIDGKTYTPRQPTVREAVDAHAEQNHPDLALRSKFGRVIATFYERVAPFDMGEVADAFAVNDEERRRISEFIADLQKTATQLDAGLSRNQRLRSVK